jgi:hypothetical protein
MKRLIYLLVRISLKKEHLNDKWRIKTRDKKKVAIAIHETETTDIKVEKLRNEIIQSKVEVIERISKIEGMVKVIVIMTAGLLISIIGSITALAIKNILN